MSSNSNFQKIIYKQFNNSGYELIYENKQDNIYKILEEIKYPSLRGYKRENIITDKNANPIFTYLYKHDDSMERPVVISIHGGPFARFSLSDFNLNELFLYKLGYNVIELNYHGSEGLGVYYRALSGENLPEAILDNLETLFDWIGEQPYMDNYNISILGGSYGGYISMLAKLRYPEKIKCAIALSPASVYDMLRTNIVITEFKEVTSTPETYDIVKLLQDNPQEIGIVYNYLDPNLAVKIDWEVIARTNNSLTIIDKFKNGHTPPDDSIKRAIYYLVDKTNLDQYESITP